MNNDPRSIEILNQILQIEEYSLANYLMDARPWMRDGDEPLAATIARLYEDRLESAKKISHLIVDRDGYIQPGSYPLDYTGLNDVSLDYLYPLLVDQQERIVARLEELTEQLRNDPEAYALAQEILGNERGHLENLREISQPAPAA